MFTRSKITHPSIMFNSLWTIHGKKVLLAYKWNKGCWFKSQFFLMYLIYFFYLLNHFWKKNNSVAWIQQKIIDNAFLFFIYLKVSTQLEILISILAKTKIYKDSKKSIQLLGTSVYWQSQRTMEEFLKSLQSYIFISLSSLTPLFIKYSLKYIYIHSCKEEAMKK